MQMMVVFVSLNEQFSVSFVCFVLNRGKIAVSQLEFPGLVRILTPTDHVIFIFFPEKQERKIKKMGKMSYGVIFLFES